MRERERERERERGLLFVFKYAEFLSNVEFFFGNYNNLIILPFMMFQSNDIEEKITSYFENAF